MGGVGLASRNHAATPLVASHRVDPVPECEDGIDQHHHERCETQQASDTVPTASDQLTDPQEGLASDQQDQASDEPCTSPSREAALDLACLPPQPGANGGRDPAPRKPRGRRLGLALE